MHEKLIEINNRPQCAERAIERVEEKLKALRERRRRKTMTRDKILEKLASIDKKKFGILELGLFGSYAKGTDTIDSDIDILVKLDESGSKIKYEKSMYFRFCDLEELLKSMFPNTKIDLIEKGTFNYKFYNSQVKEYKEKVKQEILESAIYV